MAPPAAGRRGPSHATGDRTAQALPDRGILAAALLAEAPRATLAQLPLVVAAVLDVLPLRARLDRAALVNSATGEISPLAGLP